MYTHVHSSIIRNSREVEATQVSTHRWMSKQSGIDIQWNIIEPQKWKFWHMLQYGGIFRKWWLPLARGRGRGTGELFNGYSFRFVRQSSGKHLQNTVNTINATELYT